MLKAYTGSCQTAFGCHRKRSARGESRSWMTPTTPPVTTPPLASLTQLSAADTLLGSRRRVW